MNDIKKHLCPSCGGNLSVDNDKQMYYCKSCGSTYDYEYFREEQMHELSETYLLRGEFMAAADAYKFILEKNPHDFLALRGLMLIAAHLKNISELTHVKTINFSYDSDLVSEAVNGALEKDKKYFYDWEQIYLDIKKLSECKNEIVTLREEKRSTEQEIKLKSHVRSTTYFTGKHGAEYSPKFVFTAVWVFFAFCLINAIFIPIGTIDSNPGVYDAGLRNFTIFLTVPAILLAIASAVVNLAVVYPRMKTVAYLTEYISDLHAQSEAIDYKIMKLENEVTDLSSIVYNSTHDFVKNDSQILSDMKSS